MIAFVSNRNGGEQIFKMNADCATGLTSLIDGGDQPRWSPDGTMIVFDTFSEEIFRMNADGTGAVNLTNAPGHDSTPDWQPLTLVGGIAADLPAAARTPLAGGGGGAPWQCSRRPI